MPLVSVWLIRHEPSGYYIPLPRGRGGRGGSYVEPSDLAQESPRLFWSERAAKSYLGLWALGKFYEKQYQDYEGNWDIDAGVTPVPTRNKADMRIVKLEIELP